MLYQLYALLLRTLDVQNIQRLDSGVQLNFTAYMLHKQMLFWQLSLVMSGPERRALMLL